MSSGIIQTAKGILAMEAASIRRLAGKLGKNFEEAIGLLEHCVGRIILTGMGKPGFIGRKISATLASTGSPSFFLHPAEAIHGDLGMVTEDDVVVAISNSGETDEIVRLLSTLKKIGARIIAMTSNPHSTLARNADVILDLGVDREACPLNLAPSASTTAALAMGDALALCLLKRKGFRTEDFAALHPGGSLGKKLLKVKDIMRTGKANPVVPVDTPLREALLVITSARAGSCTIVDRHKRLAGVFTDGDLRRHLREQGEAILDQPILRFATLKPMVVHKDKLVAEAMNLLKTRKIDELPVVDSRRRVVGLLDVQDLLKAGFF